MPRGSHRASRLGAKTFKGVVISNFNWREIILMIMMLSKSPMGREILWGALQGKMQQDVPRCSKNLDLLAFSVGQVL